MDEIDATANVVEDFEVEETAGKAFKVVDEVCNDETYENKQNKSEEDTVEKIPELSDATFVEGKVIQGKGCTRNNAKRVLQRGLGQRLDRTKVRIEQKL